MLHRVAQRLLDHAKQTQRNVFGNLVWDPVRTEVDLNFLALGNFAAMAARRDRQAQVLEIIAGVACHQQPFAQMLGQAIGLPTAMTLYSFIGIAVTAATVIVTPDHKAIWSPIDLIASFHQPAIALIGLVALLLATLNTNVAANVVSPSNDFSNLSPSNISFRMGGLITGVLGIACMPWKLAADPERYINGWLIGYSGLLGPIAGVMIADYFIIRKRALDVEALYVRGSVYEYAAGFNPRALAALAAGVIVALVGLFVPSLHWLYEYAWFVGFAVAAAVYLALMSGPDVRAMIPPNPLLIKVDRFEAEPTA